jgi:cysteine desulfurase / selenocysteine lyase
MTTRAPLGHASSRIGLRGHFPLTESLAYLDHAATGPLSRPAMEAVQAFLDQKHRTEPNNYLAVEPAIGRARARLAEMLGTDASRVDFAPNTSYAINVVAQGLDWRAGDRVAVPACEFPANVMPWLALRERGVVVDFIPERNGTFALDDVAAALTNRTRVLAVSWVQFHSGFRCNLTALGALCRQRGVYLCVDAIQGLGALRLDLRDTPVDFLACGTQKWMLALPGLAFHFVSSDLQNHLAPLRGWLNGPVDFDDLLSFSMDLHDDASRFRVGTLDLAGIVALDAALGLYLEVTPEWAEARILALARLAADGLDRLGLRRFGSAAPEHASGIVAVEHPQAPLVLEAMHARGVRASVRQGRLRLAPSWYNDERDIEAALEAVADASRVVR